MKKKILTLFLAFAIMMTFMPSMAFAGDYDKLTVYAGINAPTSFCTLSSNAPGGSVDNGKFEFFKDGERECYYTTSGTWFNDDDSQMQTAPESLYATDYDYAIASGEVSGDYTQATSVWLSYGPDESEGTLELTEQTSATEMNQIVFWLDEGKIHFSFYLQLPPSEAPAQLPIENVNINCTLPKTEQEDLVIIPIESNHYIFGYSVYDQKGNPYDGSRFENGKYVIRFVFNAVEDCYFLNDGSTYTGNINGNPASEYGVISLDDPQTLIVEVPFNVGSGNNGIKLSGIAKVIAAVAGAASVAAIVGNVVKNVQNAVTMQQAAFQAQMHQKAVQQQAAAIKTLLRGAGVVASLASFGSSLRNLYGLNNFGFNQFGFNPFGLR